ncbi:penicillin-binding protein 2 [Patescibacteria group bacterium]|nr:penicillin-binding protein 2 [Patescibacteria group bacterium]
MARISQKSSSQVNRINLVLLVGICLFGILVAKIYSKQIIQNAYYLSLADQQHLWQEEQKARRGQIYDVNGYPLAANLMMPALEVIPNQVDDVDYTTKKLAAVLHMTRQEELELKDSMNTNTLYMPPIKHKLSSVEVDDIKELDLDGVIFIPEDWRFYPEGDLASSVLGFLDAEGKGQYGIEGYFNDELMGSSGFVKTYRDRTGTEITDSEEVLSRVQQGLNLYLTIDRSVQYFVEEKLEKTVKQHDADSGSVVIMDPRTGKIVAMANYPSFDPNEYFKVENYEYFNNTIVSHAWEPGSVFKVITMAAALDLGLVEPDTAETFGASIKVLDREIWNSERRPYGLEAMTQVLENSDNVGMVWVGQKLGEDNFYDYLYKFGFGEKTGVDLSSEGVGLILDKSLISEVDMATMTFGQGIAITPMQLVAAVSAIANDGHMMKPYIVDKIVTVDGKEVEVAPQFVRSVLDPDIAESLAAMMVSVVENGHGTQAGVEGYYVAGKTGTAQVPVNGVYDPHKNIGSFVGFAPAFDPKFVMLVKIDIPKNTEWAESSAAPLFGEIADFLLDYYMVAPER